MSSFIRKQRKKEWQGNEYDEIIEVTAPTQYCIRNGKVAYVAIGIPLSSLCNYERVLFKKILNGYNYNTDVPSSIIKAFDKD